MVLYALVLFFTLMLFINYIIADADFFHPCVLFCGMNLLSAIVCLFVKDIYKIELHGNTFFVLSTGVIIFTAVNFLCRVLEQRRRSGAVKQGRGAYKFEYIHVKRYWIVLLIGLEIIVSILGLVYVIAISSAVYGTNASLGEHIGNYDRIVKFNEELYRSLEIGRSAIYTYGWPLCQACGYILLAIEVNNFFVRRKLDIPVLLPIFLLFAMSFITGSRSNAFRLITAVLFFIVFFSRAQKGSYRRGNIKLFAKMLFSAVAVVIFFMVVREAIGRSTTSYAWYETLFAYLGAPFLNLDSSLQEKLPETTIWGQETFGYLYSFLASQFGIDSLAYNLDLPFRTHNGINTGNVYTMYYQFIYDFGYLGIVPLTLIIALFYSMIYRSFMRRRVQSRYFGIKLIIYAYLFNDILMLTFSNRFYENLLRSDSIRFYFWLFIVCFAIRKGFLVYRDRKKTVRNQKTMKRLLKIYEA